MVQVLNVGDSSVQLLSGTCLGLAHPHAEVGVFNPMGVGTELEKDELDEYEDELQGGREPDTELPNVEKLREKVGGLTHLTEKQREQVLKLLIEHQDIFAINPNAPPSANVEPHVIQEVAGSRPVYAHGYRMNPKKSAELERQVKEKVEAGLVVPVRSAYASPVVLVKKPDGSFRFTCDYRKLNAQTIPDRHPLPRIDDLLAQLGGNQFFTCLDLSSGFFQIPLDKDSVLKTAFQTPGGLYAWKRMPQGLTNAPAAFQRAMAACLSGLTGSEALVYLDDVCVFSKDFESHVRSLRRVFGRLQADGFSLKLKKCQFFQEECTYLGHIVTRQGTKPHPKNVAAVRDFPEPHGTDKQKVQHS